VDRRRPARRHRIVTGVTADAPLIVDDAGLEGIVDTLRGVEEYAIDTEFHRERSYFPTVALVQVAWPGGICLIDPLAVSPAPLREILEGPATAVLHAATQDLEVLSRACGAVPSRLFDTQLAAGFLGFSTPSLATLAERILGISLPKASRLTDWLHRPLHDAQLTYAAADVDHLLELASILRQELTAVGRLAWAEEECDLLRARAAVGSDPEEAWLRLKDGRALRGTARGVAQEVAAWRERKAAAVDQPVRHVLSDLAVIGIAGDAPSTVEDLRRIRGLDDRHTRGAFAQELLAAVARGRELPAGDVRRARREEVGRELRPAVALVSAWLTQLGRDLRVDPALLATRSDLAGFLSGEEDARLARGWRRELLGEPVRRLLDGEFALAFDGDGRLALERRSGQPVTVELPVPQAPWVE
jgi:ribonuclease D